MKVTIYTTVKKGKLTDLLHKGLFAGETVYLNRPVGKNIKIAKFVVDSSVLSKNDGNNNFLLKKDVPSSDLESHWDEV